MEIQRKPITGIRSPITGIERLPIVGLDVKDRVQEELSWDEIYALLVNYIKFAAKQVSEQYETSSVNSAEDLFQEGQLLLYYCYTVYKDRSINEFSALFKASLWRKLREIGKKREFIQVDIEDAYDLGYNDDAVENIFEEYKLQEVASLLESSPIALTIFKEFVNPSSRTIWEAEMDVARKESLKEQNFAVSVPKSIQIKGIHIQRALEIPKIKFNENLKMVKSAVSEIYKSEECKDDLEGVLQGIKDEFYSIKKLQRCI